MNSALPLARGGARELQRIAGEVGELDHLVALIVMAEDDQPLAERVLGRGNARVHLVVREAEIVLRERLALADALLLDLVEEFDVHSSVSVGSRRLVSLAVAVSVAVSVALALGKHARSANRCVLNLDADRKRQEPRLLL